MSNQQRKEKDRELLKQRKKDLKEKLSMPNSSNSEKFERLEAIIRILIQDNLSLRKKINEIESRRY